MRVSLFAAAVLATAAFSGAAMAQQSTTWTDPGGKFSFETPRGWPVDIMSSAGAQTLYVVSGTATVECQFLGVPNANSAGRPPGGVRTAYTEPFSPDAWRSTTANLRIFRDGAELVSQTVDTSHFWPVQRAVFRAGDSTVYAALQGRPGYEVRTFCLTYDGSDATPLFERVIASVATPQDAALQAQVATDDAARTAAQQAAQAQADQAAQQAAQAQQQQQERPRRRGRRGVNED